MMLHAEDDAEALRAAAVVLRRRVVPGARAIVLVADAIPLIEGESDTGAVEARTLAPHKPPRVRPLAVRAAPRGGRSRREAGAVAAAADPSGGARGVRLQMPKLTATDATDEWTASTENDWGDEWAAMQARRSCHGASGHPHTAPDPRK